MTSDVISTSFGISPGEGPSVSSQPLVTDAWSTLENQRTGTLETREHYTVGCLYLLAGVLGLAGQSLLIWKLWKNSPTSYVHRFTIHISMGVANAGIVIGFPLTAPSSFAARWLFGGIGCQFYGYIGMLFGLASIYHLMFVALDLYRHRVSTELVTRDCSLHYKHSLAAWVAGAVWAIMPLFGWASYGEEPSGHSCALDWQHNDTYYTSYVLCVTLFCYIVPFTVMTFCVLATVRSHKQCGAGGGVSYFEGQLLKLTIILMILYLMMWSPYAVLCMYSMFSDPSHVTSLLACIPSLVAKLGSCLVPFIYWLLFRSFTGSSINISHQHSHQDRQHKTN